MLFMLLQKKDEIISKFFYEVALSYRDNTQEKNGSKLIITRCVWMGC